MEYLAQFWHITYTVIGPIIVMVGAGYLVGRRVAQAAAVLAKVLLYLLIPVYVFQRVLNSSLAREEYGSIILFSALMLAVLYVMARLVSRARRHDPPLRGAFINTAILYNSANFAIPVMALAFSADATQQTYAVAVQVVVATCQGLAAYTVGAFNAAAGSGPVRHAMKGIFRLPFIYALAVALIFKHFGMGGPEIEALAGQSMLAKVAYGVLAEPMKYLSGAYVPIALMTLGAQMASVKLTPAPLDLALSTVLRLVAGPLVGLALVKILGIEGQLAWVLVIGASGPTAIASAVVAIEFKNRPDFAASAVFLSTLGAGLTVPLVIFLVRAFL